MQAEIIAAGFAKGIFFACIAFFLRLAIGKAIQLFEKLIG